MCGIAAVFAFSPSAPRVDREELARIRDFMASRGPDGQGQWYADDGRIGLGHRRLAIIDPDERAAQPMVDDDGRFVIVFNGEIYNYRELRGNLETAGHRFRTESDTEVLLKLYAEKAEAMLPLLRGMFAFAIWDVQARRLFLARDAYGIKPLYYADNGQTLRIASQVKALLAGGGISTAQDPAGVVGFYLFGSVPEPFTLYTQVRQLPAGHFMVADESGIGSPRPWFSIAATWCAAEGQPAADCGEAEATLRDALLDSVRAHLVADVPVGAFLSAGIDSTSLVGLMRDAGARDIQTVTLAFDEFADTPNDEAPLAEQVASLYETRHVTRRIGREEFEQDLPAILDCMDQPSIDGVNTWFVSKAAAELGLKVAVSGLGGDEMFGGYPSFRDLPRWVRWLKWPHAVPGLGKAIRQVAAPMARALEYSPKAAGLVEIGGNWPGAYLLRRGLFMPWELPPLLGNETVRYGLERLRPLELIDSVLDPAPASDFARVAVLESSLYMRNQLLRDADWAGMAHSLEIRVPYVDATLIQKLAPYASVLEARRKTILSNAPRTPLPKSVIDRAKTGFVTPVARWLAHPQEGTAAATNLRSWMLRVGAEWSNCGDVHAKDEALATLH